MRTGEIYAAQQKIKGCAAPRRKSRNKRNRSDRSLSIRELAAERGCSLSAAKFKYFADRKKLMSYFL